MCAVTATSTWNRTRTMVNITGDAAVTTIVARSEGELDLDVFNDLKAGTEYESKAMDA
jgi:Na+/H+-dicarboxylate symporter